MWPYGVMLAAVAASRIYEMVLSRSRVRALSKACTPFDRPGNWPVMVVLHVSLLALPLAEVLYRGQAPNPWLFWPCVAALVATAAVRLWTQRQLGPAWNARGIVDPSLGFQETGPYRFLRHPNYLAVLVEVIVLPLAGSAFVSLALLGPAHLAVLLRRVRAENEAMEAVPGYVAAFENRGGLLPKFQLHQRRYADASAESPNT